MSGLIARNAMLQSDKKPFTCVFYELLMKDVDFGLSRFVLEVRKVNGEPYPPNSNSYVAYSAI